MQQNIFEKVHSSKVVLSYIDCGEKKRYNVFYNYSYEKSIYLSMDIKLNFLMPGLNIPTELSVYTQDGVYNCKSKLIGIQKSVDKVVFEVTLQNNWELIQRRQFKRKAAPIPVRIVYNDGFELKTKINNLSAGGLSIFHKGSFSGIYEKLIPTIEIQFPQDSAVRFPNKLLKISGKFVRTDENIENHFNEKLIAFALVDLDNDGVNDIKRFLTFYRFEKG